MGRAGPDSEGFQIYTDRIRQIRHLDRLEELELARRYVAGNSAAGDRLVESQLQTVVHLARRYRGYGIPVSDLVGEGNVGLLEALRRFDPERGLRFVTYARYWIRAYILAHVLRQWSLVDIGASALSSKLFFRLQAERERLSTELGADDPSILPRLAESFGTTEERIRHTLARLRFRDASLDAPIGDGGAATYLDMVREPSPGPDAATDSHETSERVRLAVQRAIPRLDPRERLILEKRLLVESEDAETLADLGRRLGVTRERVRQIQVGLVAKLRSAYLQVSAAQGGFSRASAAQFIV